MKNLGRMIKEARKSLRLRQWEVAEELNVARTTVSNWECGRTQPDYQTMRMLSKVLQRDLFSEQPENAADLVPKGRKLRLKLIDSPVIEVISAENACVFTEFAVNLQVNGSDSHGNPVEFRISANFCVENDVE